MGNYSVPESIRKMKPHGTMVKRISNGYYVYAYTSQKVSVGTKDGKHIWKTKTVMGDCIGTITERDGFIPNDSFVSKDIITSKNYGNYAFAIERSKSTLNRLMEVFHPSDARQIYAAAVIFFVNGFTYMTNMKDVLELSYLSIKFDKVNLGYDALHTLLQYKLRLRARQPAVSFSISKPKLLECESNGLTLHTLGQHARYGVRQPPLSFAAFDLRRLYHRLVRSSYTKEIEQAMSKSGRHITSDKEEQK